MRNRVGSAFSSTCSASGKPNRPPRISLALPRQSISRRKDTRPSACTSTLQTIISGTASAGGRTWSSTAPATAEKAKPVKPETTAPANTLSAISSENSFATALRCRLAEGRQRHGSRESAAQLHAADLQAVLKAEAGACSCHGLGVIAVLAPGAQRLL